MNPKQTNRAALRAHPGKRGFTLLEMLIVIVVITLLIAVLVPTFANVRRTAKETQTRALLQILATGIETFRADATIGGAYPPSASDSPGDGGNTKGAPPNPYNVKNPYIAGAIGRPYMEISGAGLLVWALAGADLLGTPGFRTVRNSPYWSNQTDPDVNTTTRSQSGLYAVDDKTGEPIQKRYAPFVDLSKVRTTRNVNANAGGGAGNPTNGTINFAVEREVEAYNTLSQRPPDRGYPMFLDGFGNPILYWRADPAGFRVADNTGVQAKADTDASKRGIYHFMDNGGLLTTQRGSISLNETPLKLTAERVNLTDPSPLKCTATVPATPSSTTNWTGIEFAQYVRNRDVSAKLSPQNAQGFLLVSPGADGVYGTGDDITNFEHNGGEVVVTP